VIYAQLFGAFFKIGLFAIGGAYSFLPLTEKEVVEKFHWLTKSEFLDISGLVKMFPGAISVKYATYTGYKMAGVPGALIANFANFLAPATFIIVASFFYFKFRDAPPLKGAFHMVQLVVFAMIVAVAFQSVDVAQLARWSSLCVVIAAFFLFTYTKIDPAVIIVVAGLLGIFLKFA
jgi:chromate transporter